MSNIIFYRGFDILQKGCRYLIVGTVWSFFTLEEAKRHIDWMNLDKPSNSKAFHTK